MAGALTRFETVSAALPLHAQRIAEATFERGGPYRLNQPLTETVENGERARFVLLESFLWARTIEGHEYWSRLAADLEL